MSNFAVDLTKLNGESLDFWQRTFETPQDVLDGLKTIAEGISLLSRQIGALSVLQGNPGAAGGVPTVLSIAFDTSRLNDILIATPAVRGYVEATGNQWPTLVPAGGNATISIPVPAGYVLSPVGPVTFTPTSTTSNISVSATVDGHDLIGEFGVTFGPGAALPQGQYLYSKTTGVSITFGNTGASDVTIWTTAVMLTITSDFYDKFIAPLEDLAYNHVAQAVNGG